MGAFLSLIMLLHLVIHLNAQDIYPLPENYSYDNNKALLGKKLFHDVRLSKDNTISCSSCHDIYNGGDDNLQFSVGIKGQEGNINSPTVLNARYNFSQFWNGRAKNLKVQAQEPIENPIEMGSSMTEVYNKLSQISAYQESFEENYEDGLTKDNILDAIAEFEKALVTPNARFDQFLRGNTNAISLEEKEGYELFKKYGCISCHNGVNLGSNLYQKVGIYKKAKDMTNLGRYDITKLESDKYFLKVPTLRNIELTAPYMHRGNIFSLKEAIKNIFFLQIGLFPTSDEINKIEAFLKTLTGELPKIMKENETE